MIRGMTGFGRAQGAEIWGSWQWEVRSVNGKSVDGRVSCPPGFEPIEFEARKRLKEKFSRGSFQLQLRVDANEQLGGARINTRELMSLSRRLRIATGYDADPTAMAQLMLSPGVMDARRRGVDLNEAVSAPVLAGLDEALSQLDDARKAEGDSLNTLLSGILDDVAKLAAEARTIAATQPALIRERLEARIREIDTGEAVEPEKLAQEVVMLANKADVREELDRLDAHVESGLLILENESPAGRKLDFLCQELNRETNTLCSKSASLELTNTGLALKSLIDQFREQVQNVE